jgi:phosphotransferase system enzyme I (PtsP)
LNLSFLSFLETIVARCKASGTPLSFCGEDAGRPVEALVLAAIGIKTLSMRPASIGPVKSLISRYSLREVRQVLDEARARGEASARQMVMEYLRENNLG